MLNPYLNQLTMQQASPLSIKSQSVSQISNQPNPFNIDAFTSQMYPNQLDQRSQLSELRHDKVDLEAIEEEKAIMEGILRRRRYGLELAQAKGKTLNANEEEEDKELDEGILRRRRYT